MPSVGLVTRKCVANSADGERVHLHAWHYLDFAKPPLWVPNFPSSTCALWRTLKKETRFLLLWATWSAVARTLMRRKLSIAYLFRMTALTVTVASSFRQRPQGGIGRCTARMRHFYDFTRHDAERRTSSSAPSAYAYGLYTARRLQPNSLLTFPVA